MRDAPVPLQGLDSSQRVAAVVAVEGSPTLSAPLGFSQQPECRQEEKLTCSLLLIVSGLSPALAVSGAEEELLSPLGHHQQLQVNKEPEVREQHWGWVGGR